MTTRSHANILSMLALAMLGVGDAAATGRQDVLKPDPPVAVPVSPEEPASAKKKGDLYDQLGLQGFSVSLLLGEVHGGTSPDNLPAGATKALADLREFLPYKSYRLLDTQWLRCCAGPYLSGRLRGIDEQLYTFQMSISGFAPQKLSANFSLIDARLEPPQSKKYVISSNFSMDTGETVVIGTSSLKGEKALVVLLTAVPRTVVGTSKAKKGS